MSSGVYLFRDGPGTPWYDCDRHTAEACRQAGFEVVSLDEARLGGKYLIDALREAHDALTGVMKGNASVSRARRARQVIIAYLELMQDGAFDEQSTEPVWKRGIVARTPTAQRAIVGPVDDHAPRATADRSPARGVARSRAATG